MPTPSEQKALAFLAMVVLLGGVVRVVRAGAPASATRSEQQALARQATAADSAATSSRAKPPRTGKSARPRKRSASPTVVGGVVGMPIGGSLEGGHDGFPPPNPRIDVDYRNDQTGGGAGAGAPSRTAGTSGALVDLDRASAGDIDALPRIGPALARRLVANRDSFGAFGSIEALDRVKGFGPAVRKRLAPLVTFSGRPSSRP